MWNTQNTCCPLMCSKSLTAIGLQTEFLCNVVRKRFLPTIRFIAKLRVEILGALSRISFSIKTDLLTCGTSLYHQIAFGTLRKLLGGFCGLKQPWTPGGSSSFQPIVKSSSLSQVSCLHTKTKKNCSPLGFHLSCCMQTNRKFTLNVLFLL